MSIIKEAKLVTDYVIKEDFNESEHHCVATEFALMIRGLIKELEK